MTGKPRKRLVFHRIKLMSLDINRMTIENHWFIYGKRDKNPNQPLNSPFTGLDMVVELEVPTIGATSLLANGNILNELNNIVQEKPPSGWL